MSDEQTARLGVQVDGSGAKAGFDQIKRDAKDMAQTVATSGNEAAKGVDAIGTGSQVAAEKLDRSTKNIIGSVQRATAAIDAGQKGSAKYFETLANQRGANLEVLRPYLAQLEEAKRRQDALNQSLGVTGISAKQTAAALRGVPAQFTDIVTSLQGGQAPFTVLLQQGGQLKDMFGGIGPAARALGGFVLGLVNPFTLAAAGAVALAVGFEKGVAESANLQRSLLGLGARAGTTVTDLNEMAKALSGPGFTRGAASDALSQIAATGSVARDSLQKFTATALDLEKYAGQPVKETAKAFKELADEPVKASLKLSESLGYLTVAQFKQIKSLEEMGSKTEAAQLAQEAYNAAIQPTIDNYRANLGFLETSIQSVTSLGKGMWDSLLGVGRSNTAEERIGALRKQLAELSGATPFKNASLLDAVKGAVNPEETRQRLIAQTAGQLSLLERLNDAAKQNATFEAERQKQQQAGLKWLQESEKYLTREEKLRKEIARIEGEGKAAGASQEDISKRVAFARDASKDKDAERSAREAAKEIERSVALFADLNNEQAGLSSGFNEQVASLQKGLAAGKFSVEGYTEAYKALLSTQPFAVKLAREQAETEKRLYDERSKASKDVYALYEEEVRAAQRSAQSVAERVTAMRDEEDAVQTARLLNISLAEAIERVRIARISGDLRSAKESGKDDVVRALEAEIEARQKLATLVGAKQTRDEADDAFKKIMGADIGSNFSAGFDKASASLGTFVESFGKLTEAQERYEKARGAAGKTAQQLAELDQKQSRLQINSYATLAASAKGFFSERTAGYKILMVAEQGLRALEIASSVQRIAMKLTEGQAVAAVGVANQASGDPYTALPRMAAMAAAMAALGFAVGGIGGGGGSFAPTNTGTGTVLGDPSAKSESLSKSIDALKDVDTLTMRYSAAMLTSLQSIEGSIGGLAALLVQSGGLAASGAGIQTGFERNVQGDLAAGGARALAGIFSFGLSELTGIGKALGNIAGKLFGTTTKIQAQGVAAGPQALSDILDGGFDASYFNDIEKRKKTFGITTSKKRSTIYSDADPLLERQIQTIFDGFSDAILAAAAPLGISFDDITKKVGAFVVDIGRVDLKGLSGTEIQERLNAVFSAQGDKLATAALSGFESFQKVGEGYLETVVRVASGVEQATLSLARLGITVADLSDIGNKQGDVGGELVKQSALAVEGLSGIAEVLKSMDGSASEIAGAYQALTDVRLSLKLLGLDAASVGFDLINGAGGLQDLSDAIEAFESGFLSEDGQVTTKAQRLAEQFERLGFALPTSGDSFVSLVKGIDTSTAAGKALLGSVLGLSNGFSDLLGAIESVGDGISDEIARIRGLSNGSSVKTMAELQAEFAIKTASARAGEQASIDALPGISQALLKAAEATAGSNIDVAVIQAQTLASLQATLDVISDPTKRLGKIPGFASGGDFLGGWRLVGERGPELEATGPARIFSASQTARILGSKEDAEQASTRAELVALREELRIQTATLAATTGKMARILERVTQNSDSISVSTTEGTALTTVVQA